MAETLISPLGNILRDSKILVSVDHASEDLLVVSFPYRTKLFQGILIDSTNRYLPCGYPSQEVVRWSPPRLETLTDATPSPAQDTNRPFYSLSNRFTYFQDVLFQKNIALAKCAKQAKAKAQKMTVRLRPRQVLCSKCRSICNENSENVHSATNNKKSDGNSNNIKNFLTENSSNENQSIESKSPRNLRTTLVPKLSRLEPEDMRGLNGGRSEGRVWSEMLEADKQMVLRKKRSVGSMEDLWDETVFEEAAKKAKTTPIIKISFGSPGEGTVLKIPPKVQLSGSEGEEESKDTPDTKALKKALKKAKKEAKRKISPEREQEPLSPGEPNYKKHRHRVKHKKRHKNNKEEEMKDKCLKQKLSINLKRVCGGPGEEESWSGESSRSSEPVKEHEEKSADYSLKEPFHQLLPASQLGDRQDCKENLHKGGSVPMELSISHKDQRASSFKKKNSRKLQTLESLLKIKEAACAQESLSERLGSAILKDKQSDIDMTSKTHVLSISSGEGVANAGNSYSYRETPEKIILHDEVSVGECIEISQVSSEGMEQDDNIRPSSSNVEKEQESLLPFQSVRPGLQVSKDLQHEVAMNVHHFSDTISSKEFDVVRRDNKCVYNSNLIAGDSEEIKTLDLLQGSEDSLLEMEDHMQDVLLESDKDTLKLSQHPTALFALQIKEPRKNVRQKDNCDIELKKKSDRADLRKEPILVEELLSSEAHSIDDGTLKIDSHVMEDILHGSESEPAELPQSSDDFQSISTKVECSEDRCTISDEPLDSSEDSEFLPAEDGLDCIPPEDSLFCVPDRTLDPADSEPPTLDRASSNLSLDQASKESSDRTPPPLDPAPSESLLDCPSPQDSFDAAPPINSLDCAPPPLDCQDCVHPLRNASGCTPPDLDYPPPNLDCVSSLETVDPNPPKLSDLFENSEECAPPLERLDCVPPRGSIDCAPPNLDFGPSETPRLGSPLPEQMECAPPLESLDRAPIDEPTGSFSPDISLDSIPDFPASSPIGTPQDVPSFRTEDGSVLSVGDVVWAKLHGYPWWPAKVVRLCASRSSKIGCDARVTWFGSATSSLMSADQLSPFIQTFKAKYNRERKSSGYREAIRQATTEASSRDLTHPQPIAEINKLLAP